MIGEVVAALVMGLLGSVHCALMCGPLAIGGCTGRADTAGYFGGRVVAYALFGAVFGALGHVVSLGTGWSFLIAGGMLIQGLGNFRRVVDPTIVPLKRSWRTSFVWLAGLLPRRGLGLGLATGVLPCGLLAGAWMLAASTAHPLAGAAVMIAFSIATLPGLVAPLIAKRIAGRSVRISRPLVGLLWCGLALWIAARPFLADGWCH